MADDFFVELVAGNFTCCSSSNRLSRYNIMIDRSQIPGFSFIRETNPSAKFVNPPASELFFIYVVNVCISRDVTFFTL